MSESGLRTKGNSPSKLVVWLADAEDEAGQPEEAAAEPTPAAPVHNPRCCMASNLTVSA